MTVIEIWQHWLELYGGIKVFLFAMCIFLFLGGYVLFAGLFENSSPGRRRALALLFLVLGLLVGYMVGSSFSQILEAKMERLLEP